MKSTAGSRRKRKQPLKVVARSAIGEPMPKLSALAGPLIVVPPLWPARSL
jgi:hypothetical protein